MTQFAGIGGVNSDESDDYDDGDGYSNGYKVKPIIFFKKGKTMTEKLEKVINFDYSLERSDMVS